MLIIDSGDVDQEHLSLRRMRPSWWSGQKINDLINIIDWLFILHSLDDVCVIINNRYKRGRISSTTI